MGGTSWLRLIGSVLGFPLQQLTLAVYAPAVARDLAVAPQHAMAGNGHGNAVGAAGSAHCSDCLGLAYAFCNVTIAYCIPGRDFTQSLPDALLKCRAAHIKRQVQAQRGCFDKANDLSNQLLEIGVATQ